MTGPAGGVLFVTPETARHIADLEHDYAAEHAELCAYRRALDLIVRAASEAALIDAIGINTPAAVLQSLIDIINAAVPGPSDPGGTH